MKMDLDDLMRFATDTARAAGEITLEHFGRSRVEYKGDGSEVTAADRSAEAFILETIRETYADHGVHGEEGASIEARSRFRWIVDPIDGTRSFASGVPLYGVLLALEEDGDPILGCCHFPVLDDTVVAANGAGCWRGDTRVTVSDCDRLDEARILTSGLEYWRDWSTAAGHQGFQRLISSGRFARTWGDCFGYIMVATGRAEIIADPACGAYWDYAPMLPIIHEAGGRFSTLGGGQVQSWTSALASNGRLHEAAVECWGAGAADEALQVRMILERQER